MGRGSNSMVQPQPAKSPNPVHGFLESAEGKVALITGATSGLGLEVAKALAARGATVILGVRNLEKGQRCLDELVRDQVVSVAAAPSCTAAPKAASVAAAASCKGSFILPPVPLDVASQQSIRDFAAWFMRTNHPLHVLINNAGQSDAKGFTQEGITMLAQVNYLGPYLLSRLLEGRLRACRGGVVMLGSVSHRSVRMKSPHEFLRVTRKSVYPHTKLAGIMFAYEMQRKLGPEGMLCVVADPGVVVTPLFGQHWITRGPVAQFIINSTFAPPQDGAASIVRAALDVIANSCGGRDELSRDNVTLNKLGATGSNLRYYAKGLFACLPLRWDGTFRAPQHVCHNLRTLAWWNTVMYVCMMDYPLRRRGCKRATTPPTMVESSWQSYDTILARELWETSARIVGLPLECAPAEPLAEPPVPLSRKSMTTFPVETEGADGHCVSLHANAT